MAKTIPQNSITDDCYSVEFIDPLLCSKEWDLFVESSDEKLLGHTSSWLYVLRKVWKGLQPCYIVAKDRESGEIRASLPLCLIRSPLRGRCLVNPPLTTLSDPLSVEHSALQHLFEKLPALLRINSINSVYFSAFQNTEMASESSLLRSDAHVHHEVDLSQSEEKLMNSFNRSNVRNRIRKALKSPLSSSYASNQGELQDFHRLYAKTRRRLGLPAIPFGFFEALWRRYRDENYVEVLMVYHEKQLVAGAMCLKFNNRISAEALAYDRNYVKLCPNHLLFWSLMLNAKKEGMKVFDFGRTPVSNENLITFKDRWGTTKTLLPSFSYPKMNTRFNHQVDPGMEKLKGVVRAVPLPVYISLSNLYYKSFSQR